jgi:hypothetical protein
MAVWIERSSPSFSAEALAGTAASVYRRSAGGRFDRASTLRVVLTAGVSVSEFVQSEGRTANESVAEATDWAPEPNRDGSAIDLDDRCCLVDEVARADLVVEHDVVPDTQLR